jgi:hypothetical protein
METEEEVPYEKHDGWYVREPDKEPDASPIVRAAGFVALVLLGALVMGAVFSAGPYFYASYSRSHHQSPAEYRRYQEQLHNESKEAFALRFWVGAGVGAAGAAVAWFTIGRKKDGES